MTLAEQTNNAHWSFFKKTLFRFFFIYLILQATPWMWLNNLPGIYFITRNYKLFIDWIVRAANANIFHIQKILVHNPTSSDGSWNWAEQWLYTSVALCSCIIWSFIEHQKNNYIKLNYWLCLIVRYYLVFVSLEYGLVKIFLRQMPFPSQSQMATSLGDFAPMRLAWMFMGYSKIYEAFAGLIEISVGILLLFRKTATLGALLALAVYTNVLVINLSYDVPVKLFSINVVICCLYLLLNELNRLLCFFVLNKPAARCNIFYFSYSKKWMHNARYILKTLFIIAVFIIPFYRYWQLKYGHRYMSAVVAKHDSHNPIKPGIYDVVVFKVNKDSLQISPSDSLRWQDVIFEHGANSGSIKTADTIFRQRYKRGYFKYETDTKQHTINFRKLPTDSAMNQAVVLSMYYEIPNDSTIQLWGKKNNDSLYVLLKRSNRHFQLSEKQFHWMSNYSK
jgi:hypothetical protein